jgi:hypothetical protein
MKILGYGLLAALFVGVLCAGESEAPFRTKFPKEALTGTPVLTAIRVDTPPRMKGKIEDDPVWRQVATRGGVTRGAWVQIGSRNVTGRQTVAYACYDTTKLYLGFVCEEPELQNVRMEGKVAGTLDKATDDFVEAVLDVNGLNGEGMTYSFRANHRTGAAAWGLARVPRDAPTPGFAHEGALGSNRWMLEMAIPFDSLRRQGTKGMPTPNRGDVLGIKLARYGAVQSDPKNRMIATFNTDIAFPMLYLSGVIHRHICPGFRNSGSGANCPENGTGPSIRM